MSDFKPLVLVIDDDAETRSFLRAIMDPLGFRCVELDGFEALKTHGDVQGVDVILLDLSLDDGDGVEVLRWLGRAGSRAEVVLVSSFEERLLATAQKVGVSYGLTMLGSLRKPIAPKDLRALMRDRPQSNRPVETQELAEAISSQELVLYYQPKIDLASGELSSAEALVRWQSPRRGLVFPDTFINIAERGGLMPVMTDALLAQALADRACWAAAGIDAGVAVNLSGSALADLELPNRISAILAQTGVPPTALILEITEATAMRDPRASMDVLARLRIKGCGVSIDDFGTGYSSLAELHRLPFSELKIDRSFVMEMHRDRDSRIIVDATIRMAHAMGLRVVAEGVEKADHVAMLQDMGCDLAQGYYYSRPVPLATFIEKARDSFAPSPAD